MSQDIQEQLEIEKHMINLGIDRYRRGIAAAEEDKRGADTHYAQRLITTFLLPVSQGIKDFCEDKHAGKNAKYRVLLRRVEPDKAALFGLKCVLNHFTREEPLATLGIKIGTMIEDELKFSKFREEHGNYYETILRDFKNKGTKSYRHMHRVLTFKAREHSVMWTSWTLEEKVAVGIKVIDIILEKTDLIEKHAGARKKGHKAKGIIKPTAQCMDWVRRFKSYSSLLNPDRMPCVIEPDPWISNSQGGFYSPQLRERTPLVKTRSSKQVELIEQADLSAIMEAVNAIQATAWEVNTEVLQVLEDCWASGLEIGLPSSTPYKIPESPFPDIKKATLTEKQKKRFEDWKHEARIVHSLEKERVAKCFSIIRVLRMAKDYKEKKFWYVYQCDFRGRIYSTVTGLSPQGADFGKSLVRFAEGKSLGERGALWFCIHGANCYGVDKVSYADRLDWVEENKDYILAVGADPLSNRDFWKSADKPWQFLAWCKEYLGYNKEGADFVSHLPIALDGSCNGLQNYSAMLRDEVGGEATNLVPAEVPRDIYAAVARRTGELLQPLMDARAIRWKEFAASMDGVLPRSLAKRPVMTLPYGSTRQSCREYIYQYILDEASDFFDQKERFDLSVYLTPILWKAIGETVIAARQAMDWIQSCASALAKKSHSCTWIAPSGLPVHMDKKKFKTRQVHTELGGHFRIRLDIETEKLDVQKQKLGAAPNFIHSMDASHLIKTVQKAVIKGCTGFAMIHDDFGTHACDTPKLQACIRSAFIELYTEHEPLSEFKTYNEQCSGLVLREPPSQGKLNLCNIKESKYFFG